MKNKNQKTKVKSEESVNEEAELLKAQLLRTLADYDNLVKRVEKEREVLGKVASIGVITKLLPVLDNIENAQNHLQDPGLAICVGEFKKVFNEEGLIEISPKVGDKFDENTMEAVEVVAGKEDNIISELVLGGWKFSDGQVIRHAKVKVSKIGSN
jgi:molecular chaperone GrpE